MGIRNTIEISCDYSECRGGQNSKPVVYSWCKDDVESGRAQAPPEAQYLVIFNQGGVVKSFCCQLHAAQYFLPPGYEIKQKKVIPFPSIVEPWGGPVEQADGCPENGQEE